MAIPFWFRQHKVVHPADLGNRITNTGRNAGPEDGIDNHGLGADEEFARQNRGDFVWKPVITHPANMRELISHRGCHQRHCSF